MSRISSFKFLIKKAPQCILLSAFFSVILFSGCAVFKKSGSNKQFISGVVNGKQEFYKYKASGIYDTAAHKITLKVSDTTLEDSKLWVINVELGKGQDIKSIKFPRTFSANSEAPKLKQVVFANIFWDNNDGGFLYDNYTWRRNSDLVVTLDSYKKNMLKGRFSGSLSRSGDKVEVKEGYFYIQIIKK